MRLLLVEDSIILQRTISIGLRRSGFVVDQAYDGQEAREFVASRDYDVIILDLMIPKIDGLKLLGQMRRAGNSSRVLILSARDTVQDRIDGLDMGADDYLVKPFSIDELLSRVRSLMRRGRASEFKADGLLVIDKLQIDTNKRTVNFESLPIDLTISEYSILELLVRQRGIVFSHEQLIDKVIGDDNMVTRNAIEARISSLRKKLRAANAPSLIETRRGFGYVIADGNGKVIEP